MASMQSWNIVLELLHEIAAHGFMWELLCRHHLNLTGAGDCISLGLLTREGFTAWNVQSTSFTGRQLNKTSMPPLLKTYSKTVWVVIQSKCFIVSLFSRHISLQGKRGQKCQHHVWLATPSDKPNALEHP